MLHLNIAGRRILAARRQPGQEPGHRDLQNLKVNLDNKTKEAERYKKRWQRMQNVQRDTPRSKTRRMLGGVKVRASVRKTLLFHNALITGLRDKYKNLKSERERQVYSKVVASRVLKRQCRTGIKGPGRELFDGGPSLNYIKLHILQNGIGKYTHIIIYKI